MGIDNVAIKTFNSTGAQSVCRANEADSSKLIESQFLTKCTTEYINGSGMSHIYGSSINSTVGGSVPPADTFYLPSDCDAISDVIYNGTSLKNISKIQVYIGQLLAQTIYPNDIVSRNITELGDEYTSHPSSLMITTFSIPFIGRAKNTINSFLQAGAMTNQMRLVVTYKSHTATLDTGVCVFSHQITNTEKNFIAKNIVNRTVHTSQSVNAGNAVLLDGVNEKTVDLSSININVSHILIKDAPIRTSEGSVSITASYGQASTTTATFTAAAHGLLSGETITVLFETAGHPSASDGDYTVASVTSDNVFTVTTTSAETIPNGTSIVIKQRGLEKVELLLGNDRTGFIPSKLLATKLNTELFSLAGKGDDIYIIKTADSAFSTAGISFGRCNNKQLRLLGLGKVYITVCGTQVQTTVGGTISFSA